MPGYVIHMAVASKIIEEKGITNPTFINDFILGNIIPDAMERNEKKESHFWDDETYKRLNRIPNIEDFLMEYGHRLHEPFFLGYYTHLLLDNLFVREYWSEHFLMLDVNMKEEEGYEKVAYFRMKGTDTLYPREEFLSDKLYYGDYDRMYAYVLDRYPIYNLPETVAYIPIRQISEEKAVATYNVMQEKINWFCNHRGQLVKEPLIIFEIEHIYSLMDKVVSNVCELIK